MAKKEDALAKKEETALVAPTELPDYLQETAGQGGSDAMGRDDVQIPRLKLAQGLSPAMLRGDVAYIEELKLGQAFNDLTTEIYGEGPFEIIIVRQDNPRWVEFDPDDRKVILDFDVKPTDPRCQWTTNEKNERVKPRATKFYDFVVLFGKERVPLALSFSSTGIKAVSRLRGYISTAINGKVPAIYGRKYEFKSALLKNKKGSWYGWDIRQLGFTSKEEHDLGKKVYEIFKEKAVQFDRGAEAEREPGADDDEM